MHASRRLGRPVLAVLALVLFGACAITPRSPDLVSARDARDRGDLRASYRFYQAHRAAHPADAVATEEQKAVGIRIAEEVRTDAQRAAKVGTAPALRDALDQLDAARDFDPGGTVLRGERDKIQQRLDRVDAENGKIASAARAALGGKQWKKARERIDQLVAADPESPERGALEQAYAEQYGGALTTVFQAHLKRDEIPQARLALEQLSALRGAEAVAPLQAAFQERELAFESGAARADIERRRYYTALRRLEASGRAKELGTLVEEIRNEGSYFYLDQARARLDRGETARAYLATVKARALRSDISGLFEVHREATDAELAQLQTYIAVPTFGAPRSHPDAGAQLSDRLINHLFGALPYGVQLVERDEVDALVVEERRSYAEIGDELNLDLIVGGNVSLLRVDRQERKQQGVARVQVGTRREPNPDYEALKRALGPNEPPPPKVIEVPIHESVRYEKGATTTKGFATVSVRIFDANRQSIVDADEFDARFESTDEYQDAVPEAGIEGDPLELPTETEVLRELRDDLVDRIAARALKHLGARETVFRERVERRLQRREPELAMLPLASGLLYCIRAELPPENADCKKLQAQLLRHSEARFLPTGQDG